MSKLQEFIDLVDEAPASDDHAIIQALNSADIELETLALRFHSLIKRAHNHPVQTNTPARLARDQAKEPVYNNLSVIQNLLQKL